MNAKEIFGKHYQRMFAQSVLQSIIGGAGVACAINAVLSFLYWMLRFGNVWIGMAAGLLTGGVVGVLLYFFKYRLTEKTVAQLIDRYGLQERMITMVELSGDNSTIAEMQRADAIARLGEVSAKNIKIKLSTLFTVTVSVLLVVSVTFSVLGILAGAGKIPYGKDLFAQGGDGTFEVVYTAGEGGSIRGEAEQSVSFGKSTTAVRAVADDGWMFVRWADGDTSPERWEVNVQSNMQIKAIFEKIDNTAPDEDDKDSADDLPSGDVTQEGGGSNSDELGGEEAKGDGGGGGAKWQDRNQFIDGATYYRDYLEFYYQYAMGFFDSATDIPPEIIEYFEIYFSGI